MTTITIQAPGKAKNKLSSLVKELGGEIISISTDKQLAKKTKLLNEIRQGIREVKDIERGKQKHTQCPIFSMANNVRLTRCILLKN
jgi:hypothetical protein